jgi:hypothetical protein
MEGELPDTQSVTTVEQPMWVKIVFHVYATFLLILSILAGVIALRGLVLLFSETQERSTLFSFELLFFTYVFLLILPALQITFAIHIIKSKRWTIPLILFFALYALLCGILRLVIGSFQDGIWFITLVVTLFMGLLFYVGIKYRNTFTGPLRKLFLQIPLILLSLPFALLAVLQVVFVDDQTVNDSDLLLPPIQKLSDSDNAYVMLQLVKNLSAQEKELYESAQQFYTTQQSTKTFNTREAQMHVNTFTNVTDTFIKASSKKGYQCPIQENVSILDQGCSHGDVRGIARLVALRAGTEAHAGMELQAMETALSILRLGYKIGNGEQPTIVDHLVGIALMRIGMESLQLVLQQTESLPTNFVENIQDELTKYLLDGTALATGFKREYIDYKLFTSKSLPQEYTTGTKNSYFYQKNKTANSYADFTRKQIEVARADCGEDFIQKQERLNAFVEKNKELSFLSLISPNSMGKILTSVSFASLGSFRKKECELNELNRSLQNTLQEKVKEEVEVL